MADILPVFQQLRTGLKEAKSTGSLTLALVNQTIATCGSIIQTQVTTVEVKTEIVGLVQDMTVDAATNYEDLNKSARDAFPDDIRIAAALPCAELLQILLNDESPLVLKSCIQCATYFYPSIFVLICSNPSVNPAIWSSLCSIKSRILSCLAIDNDGIRALIVKFIQLLVMLHSYKYDNSDDLSLHIIPPNHPFLKPGDLEKEASDSFSTLLSLISAPGISGAIISASINALFPIARQRPGRMGPVINTLLTWTRNHPAHLSSFQVKSVERSIRNELLALITTKSNEVTTYYDEISELLLAFGVRQNEIIQRMKSADSVLKRPSESQSSSSESKRQRMSTADNQAADQIQTIDTMDVQSIPLNVVIELILQSTSFTSFDMWNERLKQYAQSLNLPVPTIRTAAAPASTAAPSRIRRDPRRRDPRAAAAQAELEPPPPPPFAPAEPLDPIMTLINAKFITSSKIATLLLGGQLQVEMLKNVPEQMQKEIILEVEKQKAESAIKKEEMPPPPPPPPELSEPLPPSEPELSVAEVDMVDPSSDEWIEMGQDAIRRIVELEPLFSWSASTIPSTGNSSNSNAALEKQEQFLLAQQAQILNPVDEKERLVSARSGWMLLISRLVSKAVDETDNRGVGDAKSIRGFLLEYILEDFRSRHELAILWLHEEYRLDFQRRIQQKQSSDDMEQGQEMKVVERYPSLFMKILHGLKGEMRLDSSEKIPGLDPRDRNFTRFLIDVPAVTNHAISEVVRSYCDDPQRYQLGLSSLSDLVNARPAIRDQCLSMLLSYCLHPLKSTRAIAILLAKKWCSPHHPGVGAVVEEFSLKLLHSLLHSPTTINDDPWKDLSDSKSKHDSSVDDAMEEEDEFGRKVKKHDLDLMDEDSKVDGNDYQDSNTETVWQDGDIIRYIELYFALCSKNHDFLSELFNIFNQFSPDVSENILANILPLIRSMISSPERLIQLVKDFPAGSETLTLRIIKILTEKAKPSELLVETIKDMVESRDLSAVFLLPILGSFDKPAILSFLPKIIQLLDGTESNTLLVEESLLSLVEDAIQKNAIAEGNIVLDESQQGPILSPSELFIAIHNMEESAGLKKCFDATQLCFKHSEIFSKEVLAVSMQQMVEQAKIPTLYMRTVLGSVKLYPSLAGFVAKVLQRLISKKIWNNPTLWEGFIRCCSLIAPTSFPIVITLPKSQIEDVIRKMPSLKQKIYEYCISQANTSKSRIKHIISLVAPPEVLELIKQREMAEAQARADERKRDKELGREDESTEQGKSNKNHDEREEEKRDEKGSKRDKDELGSRKDSEGRSREHSRGDDKHRDRDRESSRKEGKKKEKEKDRKKSKKRSRDRSRSRSREYK